MRRFAFFLLVWSYSAAVAQPYRTDLPLDSLLLKLQTAILLQKDIEVEEIKGVYKLTPWHFAPNLGLGYDFINARYYFTFTVSASPYINYQLGKRQETRRLSAIDRRYDNLQHTSEIKLKSLYFGLHQRITNLQLSNQILMNDIEIYKIKEEQHTNHEIDTETFLKEKSSILNKIRSHNIELADIQKSLYEIELLTEEEITIDLQNFFVSPTLITP